MPTVADAKDVLREALPPPMMSTSSAENTQRQILFTGIPLIYIVSHIEKNAMGEQETKEPVHVSGYVT